MLGNWHVRFGGEGSETWHSNVLRRTALTLLWNAGFLKVLMGASPIGVKISGCAAEQEAEPHPNPPRRKDAGREPLLRRLGERTLVTPTMRSTTRAHQQSSPRFFSAGGVRGESALLFSYLNAYGASPPLLAAAIGGGRANFF